MTAWYAVQVRISNYRLLRLLGFYPVSPDVPVEIGQA